MNRTLRAPPPQSSSTCLPRVYQALSVRHGSSERIFLYGIFMFTISASLPTPTFSRSFCPRFGGPVSEATKLITWCNLPRISACMRRSERMKASWLFKVHKLLHGRAERRGLVWGNTVEGEGEQREGSGLTRDSFPHGPEFPHCSRGFQPLGLLSATRAMICSYPMVLHPVSVLCEGACREAISAKPPKDNSVRSGLKSIAITE